MSRLIIAFESDDVARRVSEMLSAASIGVRAICRTGSEVKRAVQYMGSGIIVTGIKLSDMTAEELFEDLDGKAYMLMVAKPEHLDMCSNPRIFRLPLPVNRYDLSASVKMLEQLEEMNRAYDNRNKPDTGLVEQAKVLLQNKRGFTEKEAHHHLQKVSMASGRKMSEVAQQIIQELTSE